MSDPVTNVEIEDVLSSIRRLVSEGERLRDPSAVEADHTPPVSPEQARNESTDILELGAEHRADRARKPGESAAGEADGPVRFVLTSAYRVDEADPEPVETEVPEPKSEPAADVDEPAEAASDVIVETLDEFHTTDVIADPSESDDVVDAAQSGEIVWTDDFIETTDIAVSENDLAETPEEETNSEEADSKDVPDWVALGQAELDALEAGISGLGQPTSVFEPQTEPSSTDPEIAATSQARSEAKPEPAAQTPPQRPDRRALESTIAELEAAISDAADEWEPDGSEETPVMDWDSASEAGVFFSSRFASGGPIEDAEVSSTEIDEDEAETIAEKFEAAEAEFAEAEIEDAPDPLDDQLTAYLEQDEVLDEETLRRMVAEIVREELQGPLGERITRNVRKLVRREIYRALAEQGFE
jgi:hypothetical protein